MMYNKRFILSTIFVFILGCGGGSDSGSQIIAPPPPPPVVVVTPPVDPPVKTTLSFPENDKVCEQGISSSDTQSSVNFQWNAGQNTDNYDLMIVNLENQLQSNVNNISGTSRSVTLNKATPYSWKVISKRDGTSSTATSDIWRFYLSGEGTANYAPFPVALLSPSRGVAFQSSTTSVDLSWEQGSDPDGDSLTYTVYIDTIDGLQPPSDDNTGITANTLSINVSSGNTYYWRVKATDSNDNSSFSLVYTFQIEN